MCGPQLSLPFPVTKCWLVCEDRVKRFHYVLEGEIRGREMNGKVTVLDLMRDKIITVPANKVYPTKEAAGKRLRECESVYWRNC